MKDNMQQAKNIYAMAEFRQFIRDVQGMSDDEYARVVPRIEENIFSARERNPIEMFERIVKELAENWEASAPMPLHSEIHHFIVPGVMITSLRNCGYNFSDMDIREAILRGQKLAYGSCGFMGICCGAHSVGIVICLINKTNPLYEDERSETFLYVGDTLNEIARYSHRCCKRSSYMAIEKATDYLKQHGYDKIGASKIYCQWYSQNQTCEGKNCIYHPNH